MYDSLILAKKFIYEPCGYKITAFAKDVESSEYEACDFKLDKTSVKFRKGKITPTKIGQFVTVWKRIGSGPIKPFDVTDLVDLFIVCILDKNNHGQFIFPAAVLLKHDILSQNNKGGKRAFRVYPPWVTTTNNQSKKTQAWQTQYFLPYPATQSVDLVLAKNLLKS